MAKKARAWAQTQLNLSIGTGLTTVSDMLADYKTELGVTTLAGVTVSAIYGDVSLLSTVADGDALIHTTTWGIAPLPDTIATVGAPFPGAESWPWMMFRSIHHRPVVREHAAGVFQFELSSSRAFEVHLMRKIQARQELAFVMSNSGPQTVVVQVTANMLLLS